jgi:hypothetical protein
MSIEKIFLAIILINIIVSIIASRRKKKKLRETAERQELSRARAAKPATQIKKRTFEPPERKMERPRKEPMPVVQKSLDTGKSILDEVAKELGLGFELNQPTSPTPQSYFEDITSEPVLPESFKKPAEDAEEKPTTTPIRKPRLEITELEKPKVPGYVHTSFILKKLRNRQSFREAFVLKTVLDKPLALQKRPR